MDTDAWICPLLAEPPSLRKLSDGIYSALPPHAGMGTAYDGRAAVYDRLVGSRLYNRMMWGTTPERYQAFAREASVGQGPLLDAGCGTMAATSAAFRRCNRVVLGVDLSVEMLQRAHTRVGKSPLIALIQADTFRMPFLSGSFETVLGMGMLHLFDDAETYLDEIRRMVSPGGRAFLSSLVLSGRRLGDGYLRALVRAGEIALPRTSSQVTRMLARVGRVVAVRQDGNMLFAVVERPAESQIPRPTTAVSRGQLI